MAGLCWAVLAVCVRNDRCIVDRRFQLLIPGAIARFSIAHRARRASHAACRLRLSRIVGDIYPLEAASSTFDLSITLRRSDEAGSTIYAGQRAQRRTRITQNSLIDPIEGREWTQDIGD